MSQLQNCFHASVPYLDYFEQVGSSVILIVLFFLGGRGDTFKSIIVTLSDIYTDRRNPTAVRHRCAQRCDSENEHSAVTAMVRIIMLQR